MKRKMLLFTLALPVILCQNVQAQMSRLIAKADWVNNGATFIPVDSTYYIYSGGRGGDLNHTLKFDNSTVWDFLGDTAYSNAFYYVQTFDANNNILTNISEYWSGTGWVLSTNNLYSYDGTGRLTSLIQQSWGGASWVPVSQDVYTYVGSKLAEDQSQLWNSLTSTFTNNKQKIYYYDPVSGNKINETDIAFVSGSPVNQTEINYTYSATNELLTTTNLTWNGASWDPTTMITYTYDTTGNKISTMAQVYDLPTTTWINVTLHTYSNFVPTTHNPQTDLSQKWDTTGGGRWDNVMQFTNTYNGNPFYQLTSSTGQSYNVVGVFEFANNDPMAAYYYETYSPTEIKNVANSNDGVNIYPVPAQNMLHVDLNWTEAQSAAITIYDMQGRVVRQWDAPNGTQYFSAVSVNNLASGTYFVKINGTQKQVVKQLVIAH